MLGFLTLILTQPRAYRAVGWLDGDQASAVEGGVERGQAERACRAGAQLQEVALHRLVGARARAPVRVTGTY